MPALPSCFIQVSITGTPITGSLAAVASSGFTALTSLIINGAQLTGTLPDALGPALKRLTTCALTSNGLSCPLPAGLTKLACNPASCAVLARATHCCTAAPAMIPPRAQRWWIFAVSLSFGTWESSYANMWLQGGSYCTWLGVTCPVVVPAGLGCCPLDDAYMYRS